MGYSWSRKVVCSYHCIVFIGNSYFSLFYFVICIHFFYWDPLSPTLSQSHLPMHFSLDNLNRLLFLLRYAALAPLYYRGAAVAVVVYDITSPDSFNKAQYWVKVFFFLDCNIFFHFSFSFFFV